VSIIEGANSWGVFDCVCRTQQKFVGNPCDHPLDVCMSFSQRPGAFDGNPAITALDKEGAMAALLRASDAGLVHSVSNSQEGLWYICNCCTCACGILRGMKEMGMPGVIAHSSFVNNVDPDLCTGCETCIDYCQFDALSLRPEDPYIQIDQTKCVGCGVCVPQCDDNALSMVLRPEDDIHPIPITHRDWLEERAAARGLDINEVL
jgi:Na+-translocating ferredoxin:NAD+ oxidoreductase RNF subunit RnfB